MPLNRVGAIQDSKLVLNWGSCSFVRCSSLFEAVRVGSIPHITQWTKVRNRRVGVLARERQLGSSVR